MIKKILLGLLGLIIFLTIGGLAYYRFVIYEPPLISDADRKEISLMPLPTKLELESGFTDLSKGIKVNYIHFRNRKITASVERFISSLESRVEGNILNENGIKLTVSCLADSPDKIQQAVEDESYKLIIDEKKIKLVAPSPYGVIHGLETLKQLIIEEGGNISIPHAVIEDSPRFQWRGIMLDVCRHWIPKDVVLRTLDAMATVKMNVFHWHLSEDQGFRVESKVYPKLHEIGSNGDYYTQEEIKEVVQYAADRGIRVVPEFDLPGHSKSWQIAYPQLSTVDFPLEFGAAKGMAFAPPIDPTKEEVYVFLDAFVGEMAGLFPDAYFHSGGDEVNPKFWNESPSIQEFMKQNGLHDHHDLQAYFNKRMNAILKKHGKRMLGWDEILHPDLGTDIVVQSWRDHKSLFEAVQKGGTAILSAGLYLDHILPAGQHYKVDPLVLEGAVDIEPDTTNWKMYDIVMDIAGNKMESQLIMFDRDSANVFGYFAMLDSRTPFKNGVLSENTLTFEFTSPAGEVTYNAEFFEDSLSGKISLGLLSFGCQGVKSGGSSIAGTVMPKIEVITPLTEEEKTRIIGGEACQWAEFVDDENVESRLWPRAAAIAEKLWSPQSLTTDVDDMYRRLEILSDQLTKNGSHHNIQYDQKLSEIITADGVYNLRVLTDILEEVKYHGRMAQLIEMENLYLPDFSLDQVVDLCRPESMEARDFNILVDQLVEDKDNQMLRGEILGQLKIWSLNHQKLQPFIENSEKLQDIDQISSELSLVSEGILNSMNGSPTMSNEVIMEKLNFLETGEYGVIVAVVPGLQKLTIEF